MIGLRESRFYAVLGGFLLGDMNEVGLLPGYHGFLIVVTKKSCREYVITK